MRPSLSVLEPGLERGVPWGRDLYTFVTSAAGHMMRTLQKPRKSRPSKRQVNHRRFLHNMIQRKFADIEAANHQLASALYFKEGEKSHKQDAPNPSQSDFLQDSAKYGAQTEVEGISESRTDASTDSCEAEIRVKTPSDFGHCWKSHYKPTCTTEMSKRSQEKEGTHRLSGFSFSNSPKDKDYFPEAELFCSEYDHDQSLFKPINNLSDNPQLPPSNSGASLFNPNEDNCPPFSSELSPLSLDSCDFSVQMFTDLTPCSQDPKAIAEGPPADITDLFGVGGSYSESCTEVEDYFDSICSCHDAAADLSGDSPGVEGLHRYRSSCQGDRSVTPDPLQDDRRSSGLLRQRERSDERQVENVKPDGSSNLLATSISCSYNVAHLQEGRRPNNPSLTPFEGVAQSFSAPAHHHAHRPIPTPPREDDWLFSDILKDRRSPYCYN